jgi:hypothetical protein
MSYNADENAQTPTSNRDALVMVIVALLVIGPILGAGLFYRGQGRWTSAGGYLHYIEGMMR